MADRAPKRRGRRRGAALAAVPVVAVVAGVAVAAVLRLPPREPERNACAGLTPVPAAAPGPVPAAVPAGAQPAVVVRVVDGDGICVVSTADGRLEAGAVHEVRLLGINAPGSGRCGSSQAAAYAAEHVGDGTTVYLLADEQDRDRYARALRWVWTADGTFFNEAAVRTGAARELVKEPNERYAEAIRRAEEAARDARAGVWRCLPWRLLRSLR